HLKGVLTLIHQRVALLRHDGPDQNVAGVLVDAHLVSSTSVCAASVSEATALAEPPRAGPARKASSAPEANTTSSLTSTSYVLSWSTGNTCTVATLRSDFHDTSSARSSTTRARRSATTPLMAASASLVEGESPLTTDASTWTRPARARSDRAP